jgi:hypothetical protein
MPDKQTLQEHNDDLLDEVSRLYDRIHRLEAQYELEKQLSDHLTVERDRANRRAEYWAKMYDELTEIKNGQLDDDDEITIYDE